MTIQRGNEGFTLLETIVALAILAMALGALYPIFSIGPIRASSIETRTNGSSVALSKLEEVLLTGDWDSLPLSGVEAGWSWSVDKTDYAHSSDGDAAYGKLIIVASTVEPSSLRFGKTLTLQRVVLVEN